ncbi:MAG TPA: ABATE domain-containing protein [Gemmatimonadales bacterium]
MSTGDAVTGTPVSKFSFVGGQLALDFANTLSDRGTERPHERLAEYPDLVWWSFAAGLAGGRAARRLLAAAERRRVDAAAVLDRARELREALHRAFTSTAGGEIPAQSDLDQLNGELGRALSKLELRPGAECCSLEFGGEDEALDRMLWSVTRAAVDLLTTPRLRRVKQCASDTCDRVFVDDSRNHSRRWCEMRECGNRAKARLHYRKRAKQA